MTAIVHELLMGLGDWELDLDLSPDILDQLRLDEAQTNAVAAFYNHVQIYQHGELIWTGPILRRFPSRNGLRLGGLSLEWWLGKDKSGPIIEDRRYIAGTNKLSNPGFALVDLYWKLAEGSEWDLRLLTASVVGDVGKDDILQSEETWEAFPGDVFLASCSAKRFGGDTGRLRLRVVFEGTFNPPDLLANGGFEYGVAGWGTATFLSLYTDGQVRTGSGSLRIVPITKPQFLPNPDFEGAGGWTSTADMTIVSDPTNSFSGTHVLKAGPIPKQQFLAAEVSPAEWAGVGTGIGIVTDLTNARTGTDVFQIGPIPQPNVIQNGDFEAGNLNYWAHSTPNPWTVQSVRHHGTYGVAVTSTAGGDVALTATPDATPAVPVNGYQLTPNQNYRVSAWVKAGATADGTAGIIAGLSASPTGATPTDTQRSDFVDAAKAIPWTLQSLDLTPTDKTYLFLQVATEDQTTDTWYVDDVAITKTSGNQASAHTAPIAVTPGQAYEFSGFSRALAAVTGGAVVFRVTFSGGPAPVVNEVRQEATADWTRVSVQASPDAGYTSAVLEIVGEDIVGGSFFVDDVRFEKFDNNMEVIGATSAIPITPGTSYEIAGVIRSQPNVSGVVSLLVALVGPIGSPLLTQNIQVDAQPTNDAWIRVATLFGAPEGYAFATPLVQAKDVLGGSFFVDDVTFTQTDNNRDQIIGAPMAVTPERTYHFEASALSGVNLHRGTVKFQALMQGAGRDDQIVESSPMEGTGGVWKQFTVDVTPPSGYDSVIPSFIATDIEGDEMWVDDASFIDADKATTVFDAVSTGTDIALSRQATAPVGTERVRVEVVAETKSAGWVLTGDVFIGTVGPVARTSEIVRDCLIHPANFTPLLAPGKIHAGDPIRFDLHVRNLTNRELLQQIARSGVSLPQREYRVNPDGTLDFGLAAELFETRTDMVFTDDDLFLLDEPEASETVENEVQRVKVVGAERLKPAGAVGDPIKITASDFTGPSGSALDFFGHAVDRTQIVEDAKVDHIDFARAYAAYQASLGHRKASTQHQLSDPTALGRHFQVGDWIFVFSPHAGLFDPGNPGEVDGHPVWAQKTRVLSATRHLGDGHTAFIRKGDGTLVDITDAVLWEDATTIEVELGDFYPDFTPDPQGPAAGDQFLSWRASTAR